MESTSPDTRRVVLACLAVFAASVAVRVITAEYIDIGGDNATRWAFAKALTLGADLPAWNNHTMRWPIVLPLWALMEAFGANPALYYVLPVLMASIGAVLAYLVGLQLGGTGAGWFAAGLAVLFPQMTQTGSQLWPSVFQFTFVLGSVLCINAWHERRGNADSHRMTDWLLVAASVLYFLAWGSRLSGMYFFPGLLLLVWLPSRSWRALFLFCLPSAVLLVAEWAVFYQITGSALGRLGVVQGQTTGIPSVPLADYLLNIAKLTKLKGLLPVLALTLAASVALLRDADARVRALAWLHLVFLLLFVYMVSSLDPIRLAQPTGSRYWCAGAPLGLVLLAVWLTRLRPRFPKTVLTVGAVLLLAFAGFSIKKIPAENAILQVARDDAVLAPVLAQGERVALTWRAWQPNAAERLLFRALGIPAKERRTPKRHLDMAMLRAADRIVMVYGPPGMDADFGLERLARVDEDTYVFTPPGARPDAPIRASVHFDRKTARAEPRATP